MTVDVAPLLPLVVACVAGIVWMVRLEGRINVTDARFEEILKRLDRIESNQDRRFGPRVIEDRS